MLGGALRGGTLSHTLGHCLCRHGAPSTDTHEQGICYASQDRSPAQLVKVLSHWVRPTELTWPLLVATHLRHPWGGGVTQWLLRVVQVWNVELVKSKLL